MSIKSKMHGAAQYSRRQWEITKDIGKDVQQIAGQAKDKAKAVFQDFEKIRKDEKFDEYLTKIGKNVEWDDKTKKAEISEAYVVYERANKVTENLHKLFEEKLQNIVDVDPEFKNKISEHIIELAKNNPEELRRIEKLSLKVEKSNAKIAEVQTKIEDFKSKGTKWELQDKLDTLEKAASWKRLLPESLGGVVAKQAIQTAKVKYGREQHSDLKNEIKQAKKDLQQYEKWEEEKLSIKSRYSKARAEVFLDSETAKAIHEMIKDGIEQKLKNLKDSGTFEDLRTLQHTYGQIDQEFASEGRKHAVGPLKKFQKDDPKRDVAFLNLKVDDFPQKQKEIKELIDNRLVEQFDRILQTTEVSKLEEVVSGYVKKKIFAGVSPKESSQQTLKVFKRVKALMNPTDQKFFELGKVIMNLERENA